MHFKIPMDTQKEFFEIYKQFRHAPSQRFASPAAPYITACTVVYMTCPLLHQGAGQELKSSC